MPDADATTIDDAPPEGPPGIALAAAMHLVTRHRLRLTHPSDGRLGPLADGYELGAALWTGQQAAFAGFFRPGEGPAIAQRVADATTWAAGRIAEQPAQRCDVLLCALFPIDEPVAAPTTDPRIRISVMSLDPARGEARWALDGGARLLGPRDLRAMMQRLQRGDAPPTLAAVDLAERETVRGGHIQPARAALARAPYVTYGLIGAFIGVWVLQHLVSRTTFDPATGMTGYTVTPDAMGTLFAGRGYPFEWWRLIAVGFVHLFDSPVHVASNSFAMFVIGRTIEQLYGRAALLAAFLTCTGVASLFVWFLAGAHLVGDEAVVGASGGIVGLIAMLITLGRVQGRNIPAGLAAALRRESLSWLGIIAVYSVVLGNGVGNILGGGRVSWEAHLGGFFAGCLVGVVLPPQAALGGRERRAYESVGVYAVIAIGAVAVICAAYNTYLVATGPAPAYPFAP